MGIGCRLSGAKVQTPPAAGLVQEGHGAFARGYGGFAVPIYNQMASQFLVTRHPGGTATGAVTENHRLA